MQPRLSQAFPVAWFVAVTMLLPVLTRTDQGLCDRRAGVRFRI